MLDAWNGTDPNSLRRQLNALIDRGREAVDAPLAEELEAIKAGLNEPLRVAVAGRISAGKSTLVNALLRRRVAPTAGGDCTKVVHWFRIGTEEHFEIVTNDGRRIWRALLPDGSIPAMIDLPWEDVSDIDVYLPCDALAELVIIDLPGLSSLNPDGREAAEEIIMNRRSREAARQADALLFLMAEEYHADDVDAMEAFQCRFGGLRATAISALAVLSKADRVRSGLWAAAVDKAAEQARVLSAYVGDVLPVSGAIAEAGIVGLSYDEVQALRRLATLPPADRDLIVLDPMACARKAGVSEYVLSGLRVSLQPIGIKLAVEALAQEELSTAQLMDRLVELSGFESLQTAIRERFHGHVDELKAARAIPALELIASRESGLTWMLGDLERLRLTPEMHRLDEASALQHARAKTVTIPGELIQDLERMVMGRSTPAKLGTPEGTSAEEQRKETRARRAAWARFRNGGQASLAAQRVADVALRSYELLLSAIDRPGA